MERRYKIQDLVQVSGIPRRTIRYYVQRGLLPAPLGSGRGHYYTQDHLQRLQRIREMQRAGRSLDEIGVLLDEPVVEASDEAPVLRSAPRDGDRAPDPVDLDLVTRVRLAEGVELSFAPPARVPSPARLRALVAAARRILETEGDGSP